MEKNKHKYKVGTGVKITYDNLTKTGEIIKQFTLNGLNQYVVQGEFHEPLLVDKESGARFSCITIWEGWLKRINKKKHETIPRLLNKA